MSQDPPARGASLTATKPSPTPACRRASMPALRRLAQDVILDELREELGLAGWVISGGGSLAAHLEDFYEARATPS